MDPFELCHGRWEVESTDVYGVGHTIIDLLSNQKYTPCFAAWTRHERDLFLQIAQWCCEQPADRPRMSTLLIVLQQFMASGGVSADMAARLPMYHNRAQLSVRLVHVNGSLYEAGLQLQDVVNRVEALEGQLRATHVQQLQLGAKGVSPKLQQQLAQWIEQRQAPIIAAMDGAHCDLGVLAEAMEKLGVEKQTLEWVLIYEQAPHVLVPAKIETSLRHPEQQLPPPPQPQHQRNGASPHWCTALPRGLQAGFEWTPILSTPIISVPVCSQLVCTKPVYSEPVSTELVHSDLVCSQLVCSEHISSECVRCELVCS